MFSKSTKTGNVPAFVFDFAAEKAPGKGILVIRNGVAFAITGTTQSNVGAPGT
jgi:hypothetical protein